MIDVTDGRRLSEQTVVVVGNRVQAVGPANAVAVPAGAQMVEARGKYLISPAIASIWTRFYERGRDLWPDSSVRHYLRRGQGIRDSDSIGLRIAQTVDLPIVAGTDHRMPAGISLHMELEIYVAEGLTPLRALQTATINPAKMLRGTDSLGTIAPGKLADLVLLDADPLVDIGNTTKIRAVVANGRYFDRTALDAMLTEIRRLGPPVSARHGAIVMPNAVGKP